jgi:DivIVA domain-containing protein
VDIWTCRAEESVPFSPEEIEHKEFVVAFRGYSREEVRAFLRAVATDVRAAAGGAGSGSAGPESFGAKLDTVVQSAADSAHSLQKKAERDAALIRRQAEVEAAKVRAGAEHVARQIREDEDVARQIREDAERQAADARAIVERFAAGRLEEVSQKLQELRSFQDRMRKRLSFVEAALELAAQDFEPEALEPPRFTGESAELPLSAQRYLRRPTSERG